MRQALKQGQFLLHSITTRLPRLHASGLEAENWKRSPLPSWPGALSGVMVGNALNVQPFLPANWQSCPD